MWYLSLSSAHMYSLQNPGALYQVAWCVAFGPQPPPCLSSFISHRRPWASRQNWKYLIPTVLEHVKSQMSDVTKTKRSHFNSQQQHHKVRNKTRICWRCLWKIKTAQSKKVSSPTAKWLIFNWTVQIQSSHANPILMNETRDISNNIRNTCSYYISMYVGGLLNRLGNKYFEKQKWGLATANISNYYHSLFFWHITRHCEKSTIDGTAIMVIWNIITTVMSQT